MRFLRRMFYLGWVACCRLCLSLSVLLIAAGTAVRFEPGIPVDIALVPIGGRRIVAGLRSATGGPLDA